MPYISYENRQIQFKIVYFGPGLSGKTTNLSWIHRVLAPEVKGELVMLNTDEDRTLFFDFFPVELGQVDGYHIRINLYTVPGQVYYEASRRLVLDGADGVVFVADSNESRIEANLEMFDLMRASFQHYDWDLRTFPLMMQYNKRDCPDPIPLGAVERKMGCADLPVRESIAIRGVGVLETIRDISRMVVARFEM
ncbi:MAG: gliding-motility protein MglA [Bryobacterales bacterium]|jgi:mutual gliding-motility protein MglA|nr:gliding-motility protein MglA [Bryobacterales bacterium]